MDQTPASLHCIALDATVDEMFTLLQCSCMSKYVHLIRVVPLWLSSLLHYSFPCKCLQPREMSKSKLLYLLLDSFPGSPCVWTGQGLGTRLIFSSVRTVIYIAGSYLHCQQWWASTFPFRHDCMYPSVCKLTWIWQGVQVLDIAFFFQDC